MPLLLLPLRLALSAERLRTTRITLLKATHWPFVALILAFEHGRLYWNLGRRAKASFGMSRRGPNAPTALRRPRSGRSYPQPYPQPMSRPSQSLGEQALADRSPERESVQHRAAASETIEALEAAVQSLRMQVETMSSMLEKARADAAVT